MATPVLRVVRIDGSEEIVPLDKAEIRIGKGSREDFGNDIVLEDVTVSRRHARVVRGRDGFYVEDLGSRNHTFVNEERAERRRLADGDRITVGISAIVFEDGSARGSVGGDVGAPRLDRSSTIDLNYMILERVSEIVAGAADREEYFSEILDLLLKSVRAQAAHLALMAESGPELKSSRGGLPFPFELAARAAAERRAFAAEGRDAEGRLLRHLVAPLAREARTVGVLCLSSAKDGFSANDLVIAAAVANQTAAGLERVALNQRIRDETVVRSNLERFFSPSVAARIAKDSAALGVLPFSPERAEASILFTDIRDFTALIAATGPARLAEILAEHFEMMAEIVFAHGGVLDRYVGDSIMAVFGVPENPEGHAERAVRCGLAILDAHLAWTPTLPESERFDLRLGVNSGEVVAGYFGAARRREYSVLGSPVVVAKRLESLAEVNGMLVGAATKAALGEALALEPVPGLLDPKGGWPVEAYRPVRGGAG